MSNDLEPRQRSLPAINAESLLSKAIDSGQPIDVIERLLALRERINAEQALADYTRAMLSFQSQCPSIQKTKVVLNYDGTERYRYAPLEEIRRVVDPIARENGFAITMDTDPQGNVNGVTVIVRVSHVSGHSETHRFYCPRQAEERSKSGKPTMTDPQREESAMTFATRICIRNAFGITTGMVDDNTEGMLRSEPRAEVQQASQRRASVKAVEVADPIGDGALKRKIEASIAEYGLDRQSVKDWVLRQTGCNHFAELSRDQANRLLDKLPRLAAKMILQEMKTADKERLEQIGGEPPTWMTEQETADLIIVISERLKVLSHEEE